MLFYSTVIPLMLIFSSCGQSKDGRNALDPQNIDSIELVQVDHPYVGKAIDRKKLDPKDWASFLSDFADKREETVKFYSCYIIKIYCKDQRLLSYRTNGQLFEVFKDDSVQAKYFQLNQDINLVTKYWGIPPERFCDTTERR